MIDNYLPDGWETNERYIITYKHLLMVAKAAKLIRTVEIYQWEESCTTDDNDKKNCTYEKVWEDRLIDSSNFETSGT